MRLPFESVLRRGVVFLWKEYSLLDDAALSGQTKAKFIVILSASPLDDPLIYVLTTSAKEKHAHHPRQQDLFRIQGGAYAFFPVDTLIDVGTAGDLEFECAAFRRLYELGDVTYVGALSDNDTAALMAGIVNCARVRRRVKQMLAGA